MHPDPAEVNQVAISTSGCTVRPSHSDYTGRQLTVRWQTPSHLVAVIDLCCTRKDIAAIQRIGQVDVSHVGGDGGFYGGQG